MENLSNSFLIRICAKNTDDQNAWLEFLRRFDRHIKVTVLRTYKYFANGSPIKREILKEEVRDLVQEVYIRLVRNNCKLLKNFKSSNNNSFYTYLSLTCISVVKDYFKKSGRLKRKGSLTSICEEVDITKQGKLISDKQSSFLLSDPEEQAIVKDLREKVAEYYSTENSINDNKIKDLIFQLYFLQGLNIKDISRILGLDVSIDNINTIIWRMKREIRDLVINGSVSQKTE